MNETDRLLAQAALDGEMDGPSFAAFEQRLAHEPELARAYGELQTLRAAMRAMPAARAPQELRAKIAAMAGDRATVVSARRAPATNWRAMAASVAALGIGLAIGYTSAPRENFDREVLAGHLRGMISTRPVDVVSSDRHTVKPWFAGKISVAPVTPDLSAQGFELEGGRIDMVGGEPAPTLVYRSGKHTISVTRLPDAAARRLGATFRGAIDGHALFGWSAGGASYVATSDAEAAELAAFADAFRKAVAAGT